MAKSQELEKKDKRYLWHPFTNMKYWMEEPIKIIESGKGIYLYDINKKKYIDGVSSLWCNIHGHRTKEIDNAIIKQIKKISHSTMLGLSNIQAIKLAEKIIEIVPDGLSRVFYSDSGSEGVEIALKIAFHYWQILGQNRTKFIAFENSYHGDTIGAVSVGGIELFHGIYRPLLFDVIRTPTTYSYRCQRASTLEECASHCLKDLEEALQRNTGQIAALIMEPTIQCAGGMIVQPPGFVRNVRELCNKYDVIMIVDEVATGFGRTGKMFAVEHDGVSPDIMVIAKGLTGGYLPLAATITSEKIFSAFSQGEVFYHGHTYTGNQLCCSAGLANIMLFKKNKIIENLQPKIELLSKELSKFYEIGIVGEVRQKGFIAGIELVRDKANKEPLLPDRRIWLNIRGAILRPLRNVVVIMPPLTIPIAELKNLIRIVYKTIKKIEIRLSRKTGYS